MTDLEPRGTVTTLAALGVAAFAIGRRVGRRSEDRAEFVPATVHDDTDDV